MLHPRLEIGGKFLRQQHHGREACQQQDRAHGGGSIAGPLGVLRLVCNVVEKKMPMSDGLRKDERAIDHQRHDRDEQQLAGGVVGTGQCDGVVRKNQGHDDDGAQRHEQGADSVDAEALLAMHDAADEKTEPDDAVEDDHHRREHGIAGQCRRGGAAGNHQRHDQRNFDEGDRQRQHQGAIGLAHAVRHDIGMVYGGEHGAPQAESNHRYEKSAHAATQTETGRQQYQAGKGRRGNRPCRRQPKLDSR